MLGISKRFDLEREFALRDKLLYFDALGPVEITPPEAIYESPGGGLSEDFSIKVQPALMDNIFMPIAKTTMIPGAPGYEIYERRREKMKKIAPPSPRGPAEIAGKNFLDIFFDWLNKILSGK